MQAWNSGLAARFLNARQLKPLKYNARSRPVVHSPSESEDPITFPRSQQDCPGMAEAQCVMAFIPCELLNFLILSAHLSPEDLNSDRHLEAEGETAQARNSRRLSRYEGPKNAMVCACPCRNNRWLRI